MLNTPFSPWPHFSVEEGEAVKRVLLSNRVNYWTGTETREFEKEFATWCGTRHAIALTNGTLALDLALKAYNIGPGDEVIVTPRTYIASVSCVVNAGATPVFADIDIDSGNLTAETIAAVLSPRTRGVICVHLGGWPCDMDPIMSLAKQHGIVVIEDCAQAHGATYKGRSVGSIGHIGAWSFCQDKIMTTGGEGGMITTNDDVLWERMWSFKDHGKSFDAVYRRQHPPGYGFRWLHESFGTNWRMLEMQAVIGRIQLSLMPDWHQRRTNNAQAIIRSAREFAALHAPSAPRASEHAFYRCYLQARPEQLAPGWTRDRVVDEINRAGAPCFHGACPEVYLEKAFDGHPSRPSARLPNAKHLGETSMMFLVHPTLTDDEIATTCEAVRAVMSVAQG